MDKKETLLPNPNSTVAFEITPQLSEEEMKQRETEWGKKLLGKKLCEGPAKDETVRLVLHFIARFRRVISF